MKIYRTFETPKGYARIYSARPLADAARLAAGAAKMIHMKTNERSRSRSY